jgi:hypothetical protein
MAAGPRGDVEWLFNTVFESGPYWSVEDDGHLEITDGLGTRLKLARATE